MLDGGGDLLCKSDMYVNYQAQSWKTYTTSDYI